MVVKGEALIYIRAERVFQLGPACCQVRLQGSRKTESLRLLPTFSVVPRHHFIIVDQLPDLDRLLIHVCILSPYVAAFGRKDS